jgi:germination protein M
MPTIPRALSANVSRAALMLALLLSGLVVSACCSAPAGEGERTTTTTIEATSTSVEGSSGIAGEVTSTPNSAVTVLKVYFDRDEKMQPVQRRVGATAAVLDASMRSLLAGPTAAERGAGLGTLIPAGTTLRGVTLSKGIATVDLGGTFDDGGGSLSMTNRLAQVVYTLTQFPSVKGVAFELDGAPVRVFGGEGIMLTAPQVRSDYEYATPAILVDSPAWGAIVTSPLTLKGTADVFEAVFRLEVLDPGGAVRTARTITATSGTGTRGTWSVTVPLDLASPGAATIRVFTVSVKDGTTHENVIEIPIVMTR